MPGLDIGVIVDEVKRNFTIVHHEFLLLNASSAAQTEAAALNGQLSLYQSLISSLIAQSSIQIPNLIVSPTQQLTPFLQVLACLRMCARSRACHDREREHLHLIQQREREGGGGERARARACHDSSYSQSPSHSFLNFLHPPPLLFPCLLPSVQEFPTAESYEVINFLKYIFSFQFLQILVLNYMGPMIRMAQVCTMRTHEHTHPHTHTHTATCAHTEACYVVDV